MVQYISIGILSLVVGALIYVVHRLTLQKGAANVIQADSVATAKGTKQASKEITKTVSNSDTDKRLDEGTF